MDDLTLAIILAAVLSFILALIEVQNESKAHLRAVLKSFLFWLYVLVLAIGNTASTLASASITSPYFAKIEGAADSPVRSNQMEGADEQVDAEGGENQRGLQALLGVRWFWYVFIGVFGFQGLIKRINITFADAGVLSIHDWIEKAKNIAAADAIESRVRADEARAAGYADVLKQLPIHELRAYLLASGMDASGIEQRAADAGADIALTLALEFAIAAPEKARALV